MKYEMTILGRIDGNKGCAGIDGYTIKDMTGDIAREDIENLLPAFKLKILKREVDGAKHLAYDIKEQSFAYYMCYVIEVENASVVPALEKALEGTSNALRWLIVSIKEN